MLLEISYHFGNAFKYYLIAGDLGYNFLKPKELQ
jgi:hypothetical protein